MVREFFHRLARRAPESSLREDLALHLELAAEEYVARGHSPEEAVRLARLDLGGEEQVVESWRDQRGLPWLEALAADLKFALRTFRRTPGFTLGVLLTLALGIGANTTIFSVVRGALLTPPPYPDHDRLQIIHRRFPRGGLGISQSGERYLYLQRHTRAFQDMALQAGSAGVNLSGFGALEYVRATPVTHRYFHTLGILPRWGRPFLEAEDRPGGPAAVVLEHGFWRRRFQANPAVLGQTIKLSGVPHTVVGILGPEFRAVPDADVFLPLAPHPQSDGNNYTLLARMRNGFTRDQAETDLNLAMDAFRRLHAGDADEKPTLALVNYSEVMTKEARLPLLVLFATVAALLVMACANLAGLLLARASVRQREIAVRAAMGAGARRIVRQLLTESSLLAIAGGLGGLLLAALLLPSLYSLTPADWRPLDPPRLDWAVLLFSLAVSVTAGVLFGLAPAMQAARHDLAGVLHDGGARTSAERSSVWLRQCLVGIQVAVCTVLLIGAGLLLRTFQHLTSVDLGFQPAGVTTVQMALNRAETRTAIETADFYRRVLDQFRAIPGVEHAAVASSLPLERALNLPVKALDGSITACDYRYVTPGYLDALRIPLRSGRWLQDSDSPAAPPVAAVNEAFVRRFLPGGSGVGQLVDLSAIRSLAHPRLTIVGVIADVREGGVYRPTPPTIFVPVGQAPDRILQTLHSFLQVSWLIRTREEVGNLELPIRKAIVSVDPEQAIASVRPMSAVYSDSMAQTRFQTTLLTAFAVLALVLASAGIAALVSYHLSQREREIGIRLALGAGRPSLLRTMLQPGLLSVCLGLAAGVLVSLGLTRWLSAFLFGVRPLDPATFAASALCLLFVAGIAVTIPARRLLLLDPGKVLRAD